MRYRSQPPSSNGSASPTSERMIVVSKDGFIDWAWGFRDRFAVDWVVSQLLSARYCIYYCLSRKPIFSEFAGVTGLVSKAIRGRDGCTRDFGCGHYENLSGAISWLTFFAGRAADVRRSRSDWRRELAESTICSQQKPRSFRCSAQPAGEGRNGHSSTANPKGSPNCRSR